MSNKNINEDIITDYLSINKKDNIFSEEESDKKPLLDEQNESNQNQTSNGYKCLITILIIIGVIVLFYFLLIRTGILENFILFMHHHLGGIYKKYPSSTFMLIILIHIINFLLFLPFRTILTFIVCSIFQNYYLSFICCLIGGLSGSSIIYLLCLTGIKPYLLRRFHSSILLKVLKKFGKDSPWKTAFLTRFLYITGGIKEYFLGLIDMPYLPFIVSAFVLHSILILEICFIHREIGEISAFLNRSSVSWADRSMMEKVSTIIFICFFVFTTVFMIYMGWRISKIIKEEKEKERIKNLQENHQS